MGGQHGERIDTKQGQGRSTREEPHVRRCRERALGKNPTFVAAALNGNHRLIPDEAVKVGNLLDLDNEIVRSLSRCPVCTDLT